LGIFGTDTWTNGARACDLLFTDFFGFWFVAVVDVVATDDDSGWDGRAYWVLLFILFGLVY
jgi:hypothetical protein